MTDDPSEPIILPDPPDPGAVVAERLPDLPPAEPPDDEPPPPPPRPRPGFWEAVGWQLLVMFVGSMPAVPVVLITGKPSGLAVLAAGTGGQLVVAAVVVGWRWGWRRTWRRLAIRRPRWLHVACVLVGLPPVVVVASVVAAAATAFWKWVGLPDSLTGDPIGSAALTADIAGQPWWLAALALGVPIAVVPPVCEELLDRGFIGRGLVARYGPVWGVLLTSLIFGLSHLHPVQVVYAAGLGVVLHAIYLWGKSLLLPILLHAGINGLFTAALLSGDAAGGPDWVREDALPPWPLIAASIGCLLGIGWVAKAGRVRWVLPEGREWWPGFVTAEPPPAKLGAVPVGGRVGRWPWLAAALGLVAFAAAAALG